MENSETISIKVDRVRFPAEDADRLKRGGGETRLFYILECSGPAGGIPAKGELTHRPVVGERLRLTGCWTVWNGQRQFKFARAEADIPVNERDLLRYACELTPGFGPATENGIWEKHGDAWREVEAGDLKGLTNAKIVKFRETINQLALAKQESQTVAWLMGVGCSLHMAEAAWKTWKGDTMTYIMADPYRLTELPNYGFASVDGHIRRAFDIGDRDPRRLLAGVDYCMGLLTERGSTVVSWAEMYSECSRVLAGVPVEMIVESVQQKIREGSLVAFRDTQSLCRAVDFQAEMDIYRFACQNNERVQ